MVAIPFYTLLAYNDKQSFDIDRTQCWDGQQVDSELTILDETCWNPMQK
jgi:hypothetical protein